MKFLLLGKGVSNDGVEMLLKTDNLDYDYKDIEEVDNYNYDYIVKAPGIPYHHEVIKSFLDNKKIVLTDLEIGMKLRKKYYILVSASNGKTTTVSLIHHILKNNTKSVLCGNIGYSFCRALVENPDKDIFIVEASSFQLENSNISSNIAVLLNINPCHLDHHLTFKDYVDSKERITINQDKDSYFIYNLNDIYIKNIAKKTKAKLISFSNDSVLGKCYIYNGWIYYENIKIYKISKNLINKEYLLLDYMAAICVVMILGKTSIRKIRKYIHTFSEIEYRMTKFNDYIYNDAKSTNPYSTIAAINCLDNIFLLCGGFDRNEDLTCLKPYLNKIKKVYTYGQTKNKVYNFMINNNVDIEVFNNLEEAFKKSLIDRVNEIILFSPMFASFDEYKNYIERGIYFNNLCHHLLMKD